MPGIVGKRQDPESLGLLLRHYVHHEDEHTLLAPKCESYRDGQYVQSGLQLSPMDEKATLCLENGVDEEGGMMRHETVRTCAVLEDLVSYSSHVEEDDKLRDGRHRTWPRMRVALALVLMLTTVLGFGMMVNVSDEWTWTTRGSLDERQDEAMPHLDGVQEDSTRHRPSGSSAGPQNWWNAAEAQAGALLEEEEETDEANSWRWRRQHARTAYLRSAA